MRIYEYSNFIIYISNLLYIFATLFQFKKLVSVAKIPHTSLFTPVSGFFRFVCEIQKRS